MGFLPDRSKAVLRYILEHNGKAFPEKECLLFEDGKRWTYAQCLLEACRSARVLSGLGIEQGEHVLIFLPNGPDYIRAWWGLAMLGAVMVPVNTAYKGGMLKHVCQDSQARFIISTSDLAVHLKTIESDLEIIDPADLAQGPKDHPPELKRPIDPWDTYAVMYTSGTTGPSKGVIITYLQIVLMNMGGGFMSKITDADTFLLTGPLFHINSLAPCYHVLIAGARIAIQTVFSGSRYFDIARQTHATLGNLIGTMPGFLAARPPRPDDADNSLRAMLCIPMVGDPEGFMKRFGIQELHTGYGSTELSGPIIAETPITNLKSCGKAREGIHLRIVDDHDIPVPKGQIGELIIRSDFPWEITPGYWKRPEATAEVWRNGWFHTGDSFYCDEEGNYFFVDRKKDAIRRRGENISSFEVEREVRAFPAILDVACVAAPSEYGEDEVKVFVVPREGAELDPAQLIRFLIPRMPYYMVPRYVEKVKDLPKTPTEKAKKYELRARGNTNATWDREAAGIVVKREMK